MTLVKTSPPLMMHTISGHINTKEELEAEFKEEGYPEEDWNIFVYVVWDTEEQAWVEEK